MVIAATRGLQGMRPGGRWLSMVIAATRGLQGMPPLGRWLSPMVGVRVLRCGARTGQRDRGHGLVVESLSRTW
jgi:hypothetical protein